MVDPVGGGRAVAASTTAIAAAVMLLCAGAAQAIETTVSGRVMFGAAFRTEAPDPSLLVSFNAAQVGLTGYANSGQNTDDANLNFRRGDATTRAIKGYVDLGVSEGPWRALVRVKAWHDAALDQHQRPWGNNPNGYAANQPLSDRGAARLSRFSGVALGDAYVEHRADAGGVKVLTRLGRQSLAWGERAGLAGGLSALNAIDQPAMRRAGVVPQEMKVAAPMLFMRADVAAGVALEGFYTTAFTPGALDLCGTFGANVDYLAQGCDRAFAGALALSDRARLAGGLFLKRIASPTSNDGAQYGAGLTWKSAALRAELGLYAARYHNRTPIPGLRTSTRAGPAFIAGDPDGRNIAFFTEHPEDLKLLALTFAAPRGATAWHGELAFRPNQPLQLPPGDILPAFLNPAAPSLLRADASATGPGAIFHGYDRYQTVQLQLGVRRDWGKVAGVMLSGSADVIGKRVMSLPDPALRRYGRPDQFGTGPIAGTCYVNSREQGRQCTMDGYVSPGAFGYRLRLDGRLGTLAPGLITQLSAQFAHDVQGWSHDFLLSEGRKTLQLAARFEYRQRWLAEVAYLPVWGGRYNNQIDRDQLMLAVGVKF